MEEEGNPSERVVIVGGNLEDLPRLAFIDEKCGNIKVVVDT